MPEWTQSGYRLEPGSTLERSLLVKFMQRTYQELYSTGDFGHLAQTVEQYFSRETPLWWVELADSPQEALHPLRPIRQPLGVLWLGNVTDQITGDRHAHILLVYVDPQHRRQGLGTALVRYAEAWSQERGDRQLSLQVFPNNRPALNLYEKLGFQVQSIAMIKALYDSPLSE